MFLLILNYLNYLEYLKLTELGGGVFLKINNILFKDNLIFFLVVASLGALLTFKYFSLSKKNIILFFCLLIFCFPKFILQEYFEPLFLIVFFTIIDFKTKQSKIFNQKNTALIFCSYFTIYYIGSFFYRYFLF